MSTAPWRWPVAQLFLLCAVLVAVHGIATRRLDNVIRLTAEDVAFAVGVQEDLIGAPLSPEARQEQIDQIVEDELLIREAYRLGIDRGALPLHLADSSSHLFQRSPPEVVDDS